MDLPVMKIDSCNYCDIASNTPVINLNTACYFAWIHIKPEFCHGFILVQIDEISASGTVSLCLDTSVQRDCESPWIRIVLNALNTEIGHHLYRIQFVSKTTNDVYHQYFSYIIQNDSPVKEYIYMDREI